MTASLYERLGGAAAVAAVVDDAVDRHAANPALAPLFCGQDLPHLKALGVSEFNARVGGPCSTSAADAPDATVAADRALSDAAIRYSPAELQAVVGDMTEALREQGIGMLEVEETVNVLYAARVAASPR